MDRLHYTCLLFLLSASVGRSQDAAIQPPKIGQPPNFSQVVGVFRITAVATPVNVAVEEPITLTVTISGTAVAPYAPNRDGLQLFPDDLLRDFFVEFVNDAAVGDSWNFVYRLRPRRERVQFIPSLKLVYYAPRLRRYQTAYTEAIPLTVRSRQTPAIEVPGLKVLHAPPQFFELAAEEAARHWQLPALEVILIVMCSPFLCVLAAWWWKQRQAASAYGDRQRRRAAQRALATLTNVQDIDAAYATLADYLQSCLAFPAREPTPNELEHWLKRRGVGGPERKRCRRLLASCDAVRFAPARLAPTDDALRNIGELIHALENEPCLAAH